MVVANRRYIKREKRRTPINTILRDSHEIRRGNKATPKRGRWRVQGHPPPDRHGLAYTSATLVLAYSHNLRT